MNVNNEFLEHIYKDAYMGVKSMTDLINSIKNKDNKIKPVVEEILKGYEKFLKASEKSIKDYQMEIPSSSILANIGVKMNINMEMMKDNSDSRVASMIIQGLNMGIVSMTKKIDDYEKQVDRNILKLAKLFLKFQKDNIELLKAQL